MLNIIEKYEALERKREGIFVGIIHDQVSYTRSVRKVSDLFFMRTPDGL